MTDESFKAMAPFQIGLGKGKVKISIFHDKTVHGLIFEDTGESHPIGAITDDKAEEPHEPRPGEVYLACMNLASALVLQEMVDSVVNSFRCSDKKTGA